MTENFTERFVDHRNIGLATKPVSEFPFHHGKRGFDVGALVIVLQKLIAPELKVVVHLLPRPAAVTAMMGGEGNERRSAESGDSLCVRPTSVSLVCRDFRDLKVLRCTLCQSGEHNRVVSVPAQNFDSSHNISFDSYHEMALNPIVFFADSPVFVVKPAGVTASSETGRINRKVSFYGLQRKAGLRNEVPQNACQFGAEALADAQKRHDSAEANEKRRWMGVMEIIRQAIERGEPWPT